MEAIAYPRRGEYLDDMRREPRWIEGRMALSRLGEKEYPGMTGDVSLSGLRLALVGAQLPAEHEIEVDVAYEEELVGFRGRIRYALSRPWGCIVGVHLDDIDPALQRFLAGRYGGSPQTS